MIDLKKHNQLLFIVGFCPPVVEFEFAKADALYLGKHRPSSCDSGTCQYSINIFGVTEWMNRLNKYNHNSQ